MRYILSFILAFLIVYLITPILIKLSFKYSFTDKPTKRKKHKGETPLCGGLAMFIGFFTVYFTVNNYTSIKEKSWILLGSALILLIGLIDDSFKTRGKEFPIYPRLIIQLLAAFIIFKSGIVFRGFTNPFTGVYIQLSGIIQFILTITWIFGVTTVINWSDGMDGLAGGLSLISSITFAAAAIILGQSESISMSLIVTGVTLGFLMYNKYPAKIFMGDSGANFLGFILSIIALDGAFKQATLMSLFIPILALAIPIFDNLFVIIKRFMDGKPVYQADRSQIHYRLEAKGFTPKQVVTYINMVSLAFSIISIILLLIKN
ncbi:MraY family glycosyltransferase [Clostridium tertium]|jgi:UDP-N-acetylmuramyl pentapeptide phosphotransferase/UDP-N-acetylglucosamine-1-phosphate transferase|uniref:MraY family glycosyltransferase n=2 Tax=Clostridium tertium TaxID=1559 RepID=UPI000BE4778D|nr:MraY family glycosyltransferase [Clostridium tertium]MBP1867823.1 UDP-N-acetylmuramyl pentapeptide phosphotransferase/UDP-N-acetylglucosamine-1-phosphate transferase [Clostridium tertium]MBU6137020.1 undecaprenyl/decaprenyl-phosphate alpha-N-acetylglucosaminyl 1-phosphate transferase [Clostridium tertium]MDB1939281.1 MraY family glycosyltransferase [Clostridium tertium]MDB1955707.1 MraY family glycosyltransferase [Clostridium tertium]MDB1958326.1 MraY family glycosyltransferase [Clostridium